MIEDNVSDGMLVKRKIQKAWPQLQLIRVATKEEMESALSDFDWDIVISDLSLPLFSGTEALQIMQNSKYDLPFIMISGKMGEEVAVSIMRAGAQDYVVKDNLDRLIPAIERELKEWETHRQRDEAKRALKKVEKAWKRSFESIGDGMMLLNDAGKVNICNAKALHIFGLTDDKITGLACFDLLKFPDEIKKVCPYCKMKESLKRETGEILFKNKWYTITLDPIVDQNGKLVNAVHIMKDITEQKEADLKLQKAHKSLQQMHNDLKKEVAAAIKETEEKDQVILLQSHQAAVGETISHIAHHWRQPLNEIGVSIQAIEDTFAFGEMTEDYLYEKVTSTMTTLDMLSRSIDDFRNINEEGMRNVEFSIRDIFEKAISSVKSNFPNYNPEIVIDIPENQKITGYPIEFEQVLGKIITNSFEILKSRNVGKPTITMSCKKCIEQMVISVRDNAGGIDEAIKDTLFDLYTSTKENLNNTGTGLYIARLITEKKIGGVIEVINHNEGAEFQFIF